MKVFSDKEIVEYAIDRVCLQRGIKLPPERRAYWKFSIGKDGKWNGTYLGKPKAETIEDRMIEALKNARA